MNNYKLKKCPYCGNDLIFDNDIENGDYSKKVNTSSEEHIIPKSLGNDDLILEKGIICDACNNYFALNIEKPFLELESIKLLRSYYLIQSRKKKVPKLNVLFCGDRAELEFDIHLNAFILKITPETTAKLISGHSPSVFLSKGIDVKELENNYIVSRFLVKIFTEIELFFWLRSMKESEPVDEDFYFIYDEKMKELVEYVRYGKAGKIYEYQIKQTKEVSPYSNEDFIASVEIIFDDKYEDITGMIFKLQELEFTLRI